MKQFLPTIWALALTFSLVSPTLGQQIPGYTMVWNDEFDGSGALDSTKWSHAVVGPGFVNNELQNYTNRTENARQENGHMIVEARRDYFGGHEYSSARVFTQGKGDWTYGRMEASIKVPSGLGTWPAFWMMPTNPFLYATTCDETTGWDADCNAWPNSGEIDILEHVGYEAGVVHGSAHTKDNNFAYGSQYTGTISVPDATETFHVYAIEWRADRIDYFVDDVLYTTVLRNANPWQNYPFNHDFYFIINLAFGGDWGGLQGIDNSIFDRHDGVKLEVDYVRVYEREYIALPSVIEAEDYTAMNGIQLEATADAGAGENVGWIEAGDWLEYTVNVPTAGDYTIDYRVAGTGGSADVLLDGSVIDQVAFPATSGWQDWTTVTSEVTLPAGTATLRVQASSAGFNLNHMEVKEVINTPYYQKIEAENYTQMSGIQTENCSDTGGGQNIGWTDTGDWMIYPVDLPFAGDYTVSYRVASQPGNAHFRLDMNAGADILDDVWVGSTGGWQTWQTITHTVSLPAGPTNLGIYVYGGGFNLNYLEISNGTSLRGTQEATPTVEQSAAVRLFPNPSAGDVQLQLQGWATAPELTVLDMQGRIIRHQSGITDSLILSGLPKGMYQVRLTSPEAQRTTRMVIQ